MDALTGLLESPRAREAFLLRVSMAPPWSLDIRDEAPITLVAVTRGAAWLVTGRTRHRLDPGALAIVRGPAPYLVADEPDRTPHAAILPGQTCVAADGAEPMRWFGTRAWGNSPDGPTQLLIGTYTEGRQVSRGLLRSLPPAVVLAAAEWHSPLLSLLSDELGRIRPGQDAVLNRLLDLLLVTALRTWLDAPDSSAPSWYRAFDDPVVGPALLLMQDEPATAWTLAGLASAVGVSRATLARRFTDLVGRPPMTFLTNWRIDLAADLLRETTDTLDVIARRVGYGSAFALSAAFTRAHGQSPREFRRA